MNLELIRQLNPKLYEDDELITIRNNLEIEYGKINEEWATGISDYVDEDFDPYTYKGEKMIDKYNRQFTDDASDILVAIELIDEELALRNEYKEQQRYSGTSNFSYEEEGMGEFVSKEENRTLKHKQDLGIGADEDDENE